MGLEERKRWKNYNSVFIMDKASLRGPENDLKRWEIVPMGIRYLWGEF
jgi:hypothetical protein